jgi:hypothetical protein
METAQASVGLLLLFMEKQSVLNLDTNRLLIDMQETCNSWLHDGTIIGLASFILLQR